MKYCPQIDSRTAYKSSKFGLKKDLSGPSSNLPLKLFSCKYLEMQATLILYTSITRLREVTLNIITTMVKHKTSPFIFVATPYQFQT